MSIIRPEPEDKHISPADAFKALPNVAKGAVVASAVWGTARVLRRAVRVVKAIIPAQAQALTAQFHQTEDTPRAIQQTGKGRRSRRAGILRFSRRETRSGSDGTFYDEEIVYTIEYGESEDHS